MRASMPRAAFAARMAWRLAVVGGAASCSVESHGADEAPALSGDSLADPAACRTCHPRAYDEWAASVHATASDDPVFVAMNARYQRETRGSNPSFCVRCHAPMAVRAGATVAGDNLASLAPPLHGVTCFTCHAVADVFDTHDAPFRWADDGSLRGALPAAGPGDPRPPHGAVYSAWLDGARPEGASLCGACHDVRTPAGVDVETTFAEWRGGMYSHPELGEFATCPGCHMPTHDGVAAEVAGAPLRTVHGHAFAAVDSPPAGRAAIQGALSAVIVGRLCVAEGGSPTPTATLTLENAFAGHAWPSGAAHDRRAWVEVIAYAAGAVVFTSGVVAPGEDVTARVDPDLWLLRTRLADAQSQPVRMMWQAAATQVSALPVPLTPDPRAPGSDRAVTHAWPLPAASDRVTVRVLLVPVGLDVLDDLVASGDLDPAYGAQAAMQPPYVVGQSSIEWRRDRDGFGCAP